MSAGPQHTKSLIGKPSFAGSFSAAFILLVLFGGFLGAGSLLAFDGDRAMKDIETQLSFGARYVSAEGHAKMQDWLEMQGRILGEKRLTQAWVYEVAPGKKATLKNLFFRLNPTAKVRILFGTHYDSRHQADKDPTDPTGLMPGANDGASGTAVLLELARQMRQAPLKNVGLDFAFFDAEEGDLDPETPWYPIGSARFAKEIQNFYPERTPALAIVVDMVCDKDLTLHYEKSSMEVAPWAVERIWEIGAARSGVFLPRTKYRIIDDHDPLIRIGIPAILLIDFDYPAFHTTKDDLSQCSKKNLTDVGATLWEFLLELDNR